LERTAAGQAAEQTYSLDPSIARFVASKGSITIDGVSLTVNAVSADRFSVMIVPHTRQATAIGRQQVGWESNIEVDVLARYVVRWLENGRGPEAGQGRALGETGTSSDETLMKRLASSGFL
jgi:riboflavin synthase